MMKRLFICLCWSSSVFAEPELSSRFKGEEKASLVKSLGDLKKIHNEKVDWSQFVETRIRHFIPEEVDPSKNLSGSYGKIELPRTSEVSSPTSAQNLSYLYFFRILNFADLPEMFVNIGSQSGKISITQANVGVVRLLSSYFKNRHDLRKVGILVHEARHSDCPNGIEDSVIEKLQKNADPNQVADVLAESTCTFSHSLCPEGHDYQGKRVCDAQVWGANAVEMAFYKDIISNCPECSADEKMVAKTLAFDRANLVLDVEGLYEKRNEWKEFRP